MPKVLWICADQWRGDCLSAKHHPVVNTPVLDSLAAQGALFENHHTVTVPCGPARASLVTGQYLFNHRSVANGVPLANCHTTVAQAAHALGVDCFLFGYTDTVPDPATLPAAAPAFRDYQSAASGFFPMAVWRDEQDEDWFMHLAAQDYPFADDPLSILPSPAANDNPQPFNNAPAPYRAEDSDTAYLATQCINYLRANGKKRDWLIKLAFLRPHPPLMAPAPYNDMYPHTPAPVKHSTRQDEMAAHPLLAAWLQTQQQPGIYQNGLITGSASEEEQALMRNVYYGLINEVDYHIGRVLKCLDDSGLADDTLVIFTSDHGEMAGAHYCWGKGGYFNDAYHIPLIIRDPRQQTQGTRVNAFTESVDLLPTIINWLGGDAPLSANGSSLLPLMDSNNNNNGRELAFFEHDFRHATGAAYDKLRAEYSLTANTCLLQGLRGERYKYVHFAGGLPNLLFDLQEDPHEFDNRINDPALQHIVSDMRARLLEHRMRHAPAWYADFIVSPDGLKNTNRT